MTEGFEIIATILIVAVLVRQSFMRHEVREIHEMLSKMAGKE